MPPSPLAVGKASREFSSRMSPHTLLSQADSQHLRNLSSNSNSYDSHNSPFVDRERESSGGHSQGQASGQGHLHDHSHVPGQGHSLDHSAPSPMMMSPSSLVINRASHNSSPAALLGSGTNSTSECEVTQTHIQTMRSISSLCTLATGQFPTDFNRSKSTPGYTSPITPITPQKKYITKGIRRSPAPALNFKSSILSIREPSGSALGTGPLGGGLKRKQLSSAGALPLIPSGKLGPGNPQSNPPKKKKLADQMETDDPHEQGQRLADWVNSTSVLKEAEVGPVKDSTSPALNSKARDPRAHHILPIIPQLPPLQVGQDPPPKPVAHSQSQLLSSGFSSPFSPFSARSKSPTASDGSIGSSDLEVLRILKSGHEPKRKPGPSTPGLLKR